MFPWISEEAIDSLHMVYAGGWIGSVATNILATISRAVSHEPAPNILVV
jgi:hypothetical protein